MAFLRRISLITFIILVAASIFQDLSHTGEITPSSNNEIQKPPLYEAVPVKVNAGDTVLSITEELQTMPQASVSEDVIVTIFESLNPTVTTNDIRVHEIYYFPKFQSQNEKPGVSVQE